MTEKGRDSDMAQIVELWNEFAAAASSGDIERWLALWIDEGIQMPPGTPRRDGKSQIRSEMQPAFDAFNTKMEVNPEGTKVIGDRAYSHGFYSWTSTPKEGGDTHQGNGKFLTILEKQADGSWKIAIDCFNNDAPPN